MGGIMPNKRFLPLKKDLERCLKVYKYWIRVIFPDGAESSADSGFGGLNRHWHSLYWEKEVFVIEISGDGKTIWVE